MVKNVLLLVRDSRAVIAETQRLKIFSLIVITYKHVPRQIVMNV